MTRLFLSLCARFLNKRKHQSDRQRYVEKHRQLRCELSMPVPEFWR